MGGFVILLFVYKRLFLVWMEVEVEAIGKPIQFDVSLWEESERFLWDNLLS